MKTFCVIPAYNEEKKIVKVINKVYSVVDRLIVVDDGSKDNTYELAREQEKNITNLKVLTHVINRGQGAALQTGNEYALNQGADIIVHFDADGQFLTEEINDIINPIKYNDFDLVFGSRFMEKKSNMPYFKAKVIMPLGRIFNRVFFKIKTTDPQCGFRAMNRQAAKKIIIKNDGSAHCSEILHKAFKNNFKIKEVAITVIYNEFGQGLFGGKGAGTGGFKIIKDLLLSKLVN